MTAEELEEKVEASLRGSESIRDRTWRKPDSKLQNLIESGKASLVEKLFYPFSLLLFQGRGVRKFSYFNVGPFKILLTCS